MGNKKPLKVSLPALVVNALCISAVIYFLSFAFERYQKFKSIEQIEMPSILRDSIWAGVQTNLMYACIAGTICIIYNVRRRRKNLQGQSSVLDQDIFTEGEPDAG